MDIQTNIKQSDGTTGMSRFKTPRPVAPDPGGTRDSDTGRRIPPVGAKHPTPVFLAALSALLAAAVFIGDLLVPLGVAGGVPYVAVVLVGWWYPKRHYVFFMAAIASALTLAGYVWSPDGGIPWMIVTNRLLALFAIWLTAFLLFVAKTATAEVCESEARLRGAIESLQEGFLLFDKDGHLVMVNEAYRRINPKAGEYLKKGMRFEDWIRANVESWKIVEAVGREEEFIRERLEQPRNPTGSIICPFSDGKWYILKETRTPEGDIALTFTDITEVKQAEKVLSESEEIRQSEERLRALFETSPIGVSIFLPETNTRLYMNPAMVKLFGAASEEQLLEQDIKKTWADPADLDRLRTTDPDDFTEEIEAERVRLDGTKWWCHMHRRQIEFEGQNAIMNWHYDITERKRAEEEIKRLNEDLEQRVEERTKELLEGEERFRRAVHNSPIPIIMHAEDGEVLMVSNKWIELSGYSLSDIPTIFDWTEKAYGADKKGLKSKRKMINALYDLKEPSQHDAFVITALGEKRIWDVHNAPLGRLPDGRRFVISMALDITERKRAEEALKESRARLVNILDNSPAPIYFKDTKGRFLVANKQYQKMYDVDFEAIKGKTSKEIFGDDLGEMFFAHDQEVLNTRKVIEREESIFGKTYLTLKFPIIDPAGELLGLGGIETDITDIKKTEAALRKSEARLLEAQKIARLGNWSRDLKTNQMNWSDETFRIYGYELGAFELTFDRFMKILHPDDVKRVMGSLERAISRKTPYELDYRIVRPDGEIRMVHARVAVIADDEGKSVEVVGTVQDITERKKAEEALRKRTELVELIHRVAVAANKAKSVNWAMKTCLREICAYTGWSMGHLFVLAPDSTETLVPTNVWHQEGTQRFDAFRKATAKITFERCEGLPGRVLASGKPEWMADLSDPKSFLRAKAAAKSCIKSGFALPVMIGREVVAVLEFFSTERIETDKPLLRVLVDIATQLSRVIERKRAGDQLKESEERKGHILGTALDAIVTIDEDGRVIEFNPTAEGMFGYTNDEAKGRNVADLIISPDLRERHRGEIEKIKRSGKSRLLGQRFEVQALRADGREFPTELTVSRFTMAGRNYFTAFIRDISQQKIASENIRKLTQAVEQSPVSVVITDLDATIEYVNPKFVEVTGYSSDEAIGRNPRMLKSGMNPPELYEDLWGKLTSGQEWRGELCNKKKNGELYWEYATIAPLKAPDGTVTHYIAVKEDITERRITEETLRQSQKMEALGQLTGGIAHDFNNLLGIIIGHLDLVQQSGIEDEETLKDINEAQKAALRGASLTQRLLNFSRRKPKSARSININWIIESMKGMLAKSLTSEIDFIFHLADNLWPAEIDPTDMENAILNMCINAKDAMPQRGVLTIKTGNKILDRNDVASEPGLSPGKYVLTTVSDTGSGMSPETQKQMFNPFFTTKKQGKGSGLGLSMVYGFIKRSGGHITVESELGKGSTFRMYLPCASSKAEGRSTDGKKNRTMPGGHETILVVDDEPKLLRSAAKTLRTLGYSVLCAENAHEALKSLKDNGNIDLLFSDIVMPGRMNGIELAEAAREKNPGLKVLMTSGFDQGAITKWRHLDLVETLLQKPYRMIDLATRVRATLDAES